MPSVLSVLRLPLLAAVLSLLLSSVSAQECAIGLTEKEYTDPVGTNTYTLGDRALFLFGGFTTDSGDIGATIAQMSFQLAPAGPQTVGGPSGANVRLGVYYQTPGTPNSFTLATQTDNIFFTNSDIVDGTAMRYFNILDQFVVPSSGMQYFFGLASDNPHIMVYSSDDHDVYASSFSYTSASTLPSPYIVQYSGGLEFNEGVVLCESTQLVGGLTGDPVLMGFHGHSMQVHGIPLTVYNLISTPAIQQNAQWVFLDAGECNAVIKARTECWSHPGTYIKQLAIRAQGVSVETRLHIVAGSHSEGLTVWLDGKQMLADNSTQSRFVSRQLTVTVTSDYQVSVRTPEYVMQIDNSDGFLNQRLSMTSRLQAKLEPVQQAEDSKPSAVPHSDVTLPHGLLGQTWLDRPYSNTFKWMQGELDDYRVEDGMWGTHCTYNRYQA